MLLRIVIIVILVGVLSPAWADNVLHGLRVADGFEVAEFAGSDLANDIYCLTFDPRGRVVVSGRGYIRILEDGDGDGRADRAIEFAGRPKDGAMGLLWEGDTLYVTGDGGLRRYRDQDGDGRADGPSELIRAMKTGGEHDAHAVKRGPDGWLYVLCGNSTGIDKKFAMLPSSPVKDPVAGCVVRFTPDLRASEIVADGFRNAYDMDFNPDGELFTHDSDNERCVSLPWYEPTRFYHVVPGGHHGWRSPQRAQFWRWPTYFADIVAPVAMPGRGSPTGVTCYRHVCFPTKYRGGFFLADWTFGRIYFVPLTRLGSSYTGRPEVFLQSVGDNGFAPTALAVHPRTGELFVSIGGRGTRGAVYRVRYSRGEQHVDPSAVARLQPKPRSLDRPADAVRGAADSDAPVRLRALTDLRRYRSEFSAEQVRDAVRANWDHADRYLKRAAADLIATLDERERGALLSEARTPVQQATYALGVRSQGPREAIGLAAQLVAAKKVAPDVRLMAVRAMQEALGGITAQSAMGTVWEGYSLRRDPPKDLAVKAAAVLRAAFPTGHADLDREVSRTLALLEDDEPSLPARVLDRITASSSPVEDIHYLIVLARLRSGWTAALTERTAGALLALDRKVTAAHLNRDRNWPLRIAELHAELARRHRELNVALLRHDEFGRPDHALFARADGFDLHRAAEIFLARAARDKEYAWTPAVVEVVAALSEEQSLPVLRRLWDHGGLQEAILPVLARRPEAADRDRFLAGLRSPQLGTVRLCLGALEKLPPRQDGAEALTLLRCLRQLPEGREGDQLRERLGKYLERVTGQKGLGADRQRWGEWFAKTYPALAPRLEGADGVDVASWKKRLSQLDWSTGDARRGQVLFQRASCASCHSGAQALGPDLQGVAGRFSRDDLFTAVLQPSRDISPRYRTTAVTLADGKTYQGMVIYEAVDSLILQTGPAATVRLSVDQIEGRRVTDTSLMPAGLLDPLTDREIADLYAYLKSLGK